MTNFAKTIAKGTLGTVAAGAIALASASPAIARDSDNRINAGEIIAGALILGGIAAVASSSRGDRYNKRTNVRYRDRNYRSNNRFRSNNPRAAVERCVRVAERRAKRAGYRFADVTQIRDVDDTRYGYRVKGRLVVDGARGFNRNHRFNNRFRYDERRFDRGNYRNGRADRGRFTCFVERGQRAQVQFRGIRGL